MEEDGDGGALKQSEFPAWASNKEYLAYNSPSATFLGNIVDFFLTVTHTYRHNDEVFYPKTKYHYHRTSSIKIYIKSLD